MWINACMCISYNIIFLSGLWIINRYFDSDGCNKVFKSKFIDIKWSIYGEWKSCFRQECCLACALFNSNTCFCLFLYYNRVGGSSSRTLRFCVCVCVFSRLLCLAACLQRALLFCLPIKVASARIQLCYIVAWISNSTPEKPYRAFQYDSIQVWYARTQLDCRLKPSKKWNKTATLRHDIRNEIMYNNWMQFILNAN